MVVADLQTQCTATLRRFLAESADAARAAGEAPPPVGDEALNAFISSLAMKDNPRLQVESAEALVEIFDCLTVAQQHEVQGKLVSSLLKQPPRGGGGDDDDKNDDDEPPSPMVGDWLREMISSEDSDDSRNLILGTIVRGIRTHDDPDLQLENMGYLRSILKIETDPPVQEVVKADVVLDIVVLLLRNDNRKLQRAATSVLDQLLKAGRHTNVEDAVVAAGAIPALLRLLRLPNVPDNARVKEGAAWVVKGFASTDRHYGHFVLQYGFMQPLVEMALTNSDSSGARRSAVAAISSIFSQWEEWEDPPIEAAQQALAALKEVIKGEDEMILHFACTGLQQMTMKKGEYMELVIFSGVCPRLVELLNHPSPKVLEPVIQTIGNIFVHGSYPQAWAVLLHDPFPSFHKLMVNPGNYPRACTAICNLAKEQGRNGIQNAIDAGMIPSVIELLGSSDSDVRCTAARTISFFAGCGTIQQTQVVVGAGCIPPLCRILNVDPEDSKFIITTLLAFQIFLIRGRKMAQNDARRQGDEGSTAAANPVAALIVSADAGVPSKIRTLKRHSDISIRELAANLLREYFSVGENDEVDAAVAGMEGPNVDGDVE